MFGRIPLDFCMMGLFFITNSISLLMISLFQLSVSSWFRLGRLYVSRNLSISSLLPNLLAYKCSILLWFLYLCGISCYFSSFHFLFWLFGSFLFSSWWVWLEVYQFYLFRKPAYGFIDLSFIFLSFFFLSFFLSFFLPSFLPSSLPPFLPSFLPSFPPSLLPSFLPFFLSFFSFWSLLPLWSLLFPSFCWLWALYFF